MTSPIHETQPPGVALASLMLRLYYNQMDDDHKHLILEFAEQLIEAQRSEQREDDGSHTCLNAHVLWDAGNAERFGDLCRRTLGLCEEGQPCAPVSTDGRILLVSSERGLPATPPSTADPGAAANAPGLRIRADQGGSSGREYFPVTRSGVGARGSRPSRVRP